MIKKEKIGILIGVLAIGLIAALVISNTGTTGLFTQNTADKNILIRIGNLPAINGLPVYIAIDKNYFINAGLNVELKQFESPGQIIDAIMQDKLEFTTPSGASGISAIANQKNPGKIMIYAIAGGTKEAQQEELLIPIDSNITSIKELKGKRVGIQGGSIQWKTIARDMFAKNGLNADTELTLVELAPATQIPTIAAHQIDALLAIEPIPTTAKEKKIAKSLLSAPMEKLIADPIYVGAGIVNIKFAKEHPEETKKFIEIIKKATEEMKQNPETAKQYLSKYTPITSDIAAKTPLPTIKICGNITQEDVDALQKLYDIFSTYGVVEQRLNASALLYCEAA